MFNHMWDNEKLLFEWKIYEFMKDHNNLSNRKLGQKESYCESISLFEFHDLWVQCVVLFSLNINKL